MTAGHLLIRADASTEMGAGHVMRCLALAQAWQEQEGEVTFVSALPGTLRDRLLAEGLAVHAPPAAIGSREDASQVIEAAQQIAPRCVVIDGYHFGAGYQKWLTEAGLRLLMLDDNGHADHYYADLVLNQNIHASECLYARREPATQLLLGTRYALLRREFWAWRGWQREIPDVARRVLVTMGGADPDNVTAKVLQALDQVDMAGLQVRVVVGPANPHREALLAAARSGRHAVELLANIASMPELMAWADAAVTAGGSTCWELAFMGAPSAIIVLADNQRAIAEGLDAAGAALNLGWHGCLSVESLASAMAGHLLGSASRASMAEVSRGLVDGAGVARVLGAISGEMS
jgi:UDP-2,4-diacetamido-2,4,6-trideoxy-beta-L-altropyranose hydrolase